MFEEASIAGKGRGLVASKDIDPGCEVICEEALVVGPGSREACLECLLVEDEGCEESCSKCGHSLCKKCSAKSAESFVWHSDVECNVLTILDQDPATVFNFIFPLRLAILRKNNRAAFDKVMLLESHVEKRLNQVFRRGLSNSENMFCYRFIQFLFLNLRKVMFKY
jgi:hypothetical protein